MAWLSTKEWVAVRLSLLKKMQPCRDGGFRRRFIFSENFIRKERAQLHEFRSIFRDIINLINARRELISFIFMGCEGAQGQLQSVYQSPQKSDGLVKEIHRSAEEYPANQQENQKQMREMYQMKN